MRRLLAGVSAVAAALSWGTSTAGAEPVTIATVSANVPIAAEGGWVAWSTLREGGWRLTAWHQGTVTTLPAAPRPEPFDVDLGTDADGRTVASFSRCAVTPKPSFWQRTASWTGAGCEVRVLDLATGIERASGVPRRGDSSDTTPSMWRGRIAFARSEPDGDVAQVKLWSPRTRRLKTLRHGGVPSKCVGRGGCRGGIEGMDLGARLVAFLWWIEGLEVTGHGGWEVRVDRTATRRTVLAGSGFLGEACTEGTDVVAPSLPVIERNHLWFSVLRSACYANRVTVVRFDVRRRLGSSGPVPGDVLQFAKDGGAVYALVAPKPAPSELAACDTPAGLCTIQRLDPPLLTKRTRRPRPPFI